MTSSAVRVCHISAAINRRLSGVGITQLQHLATVERMRVTVATETAKELLGGHSAGLGQFDQRRRRAASTSAARRVAGRE